MSAYFVAHIFGYGLSAVERIFQRARRVMRILARDFGQAFHFGERRFCDPVGVGAARSEQFAREPFFLSKQRAEQMDLFYLLVAVFFGKTLRRIYRFGAFLSIFLEVHKKRPPSLFSYERDRTT